ncbi:very long chain fatty acid elongase 2-like [Ostrinia nubilalis]|uniref:very long chain fatty acid elongase 2-like n=1 Tax=Ostrinia nubilalis TaxID=29057 RepID=UPI00308264FB
MDVYNHTNGSLRDFLWDFRGKVHFVDKWYLMTSPMPILAILLVYLFIVLNVGPKLMKSRPAMNLNKVLVLYNVIQIFVSIFLFTKGFHLMKAHGFLQRPCLLNNEKVMMGVTSGIYYYLTAKISELLDTVFFVLRKKQNQVTFLHVYHHSGMVLYTWFALKYEPTYSVVFLGTVNSFIHIIMYLYYGLSAFPSLAKYLWWKKYITSMQLIQFVLILFHAIANYAYGSCPPSYVLFSMILFNTAFLLLLFFNFYVKSYVKNTSSKTAKKKII